MNVVTNNVIRKANKTFNLLSVYLVIKYYSLYMHTFYVINVFNFLAIYYTSTYAMYTGLFSLKSY